MTIEVARRNNFPQLVGIVGHAGVGKDTAAIYLNSRYQNVYGEAFAGPLKKACAEMFGIDLVDFHDRAAKELTSPFWGISPRKIAQFVGTDLVRFHMAELLGLQAADNFWIRRLEGRLTGELVTPDNEGEYDETDIVCITDVRFQNEYDWILENGGKILHIIRPGCDGNVGIPGHYSERGITFNSIAADRTWQIFNSHSLEVFHNSLDSFAKYISLVPKEPEFDDPFPL
jgi:hypothetical protein